MKYIVKHDFSKSQPSWSGEYAHIFGARNEGFTIMGENAKTAFAEWNESQLPGKRLNPFYLSITEVKL